MLIAEEIKSCLKQAFAPRELDVVDDSASHAGHSGNPGGDGETHFKVMIRAQAFEGMSCVARHRAVHSALGDIVPHIHALALDLDS